MNHFLSRNKEQAARSIRHEPVLMPPGFRVSRGSPGMTFSSHPSTQSLRRRDFLWRKDPALFAGYSRGTPIRMTHTDKQLEQLLSKAQEDSEILAVLLFGSTARGERTTGSDVDVCLFLQPKKYDSLALSRKKLTYLQGNDLDVHVFQQLPLYIRHRVLKEGKVLFARDLDTLYAFAFRTIQEFEDFKPIYRAYLAEVARAGS